MGSESLGQETDHAELSAAAGASVVPASQRNAQEAVESGREHLALGTWPLESLTNLEGTRNVHNRVAHPSSMV
jgi:homospermidine synthase